MPEIARLSGSNDAIELDFVEREATPKEMMELAIHLHLGGLSLSDTVSVLDNFGVSRARSTVHNWVQKADLEPRGVEIPRKSHSMRRSSRSTENGSGSSRRLNRTPT